MSWFKKVIKEVVKSSKPEKPGIPDREIHICDECKGKGKIKHKRKADAYEYRYGGYHEYIKWEEECKNCNGTGKVIKIIPVR